MEFNYRYVNGFRKNKEDMLRLEQCDGTKDRDDETSVIYTLDCNEENLSNENSFIVVDKITGWSGDFTSIANDIKNKCSNDERYKGYSWEGFLVNEVFTQFQKSKAYNYHLENYLAQQKGSMIDMMDKKHIDGLLAESRKELASA